MWIFLGIAFPGVLLQSCPCKGILGKTGAASGCVQGAWGCFSSKSLERVWDSTSRLILNPLIVCFGNVSFLKNHPWKWGRALQS